MEGYQLHSPPGRLGEAMASLPSFEPEDDWLTCGGEISKTKLSETLNIFAFLLTRATEVAPTSGTKRQR